MLIDSNIIIYSLNSSSPKCKLAKKFILDNFSEITVAQQNILETIRVISHPKYPKPFKYDEALLAVDKIVRNLTIIQPSSETIEITYMLAKKYKISGNEIFDAYLVATALSNDEYEIYSDNVKHLGKYKEIKVKNPFIKN